MCGSVEVPTLTTKVVPEVPITWSTLKLYPRFPLGYVTIPGPEVQVNPSPINVTTSPTFTYAPFAVIVVTPVTLL